MVFVYSYSCTYISTARIGMIQLAKLLGLILLCQFDGLEEQLLKGLSTPS